ncbi:MAG: lamin tail domain-containing protein [Bacteroidales bacterium]|nr:lamin tail domain-containing protein [Bacteroidales bacterium]
MKEIFTTYCSRILIISSLLLLPNFFVSGQTVRIDEFMALNQTTIADEDGEYSDWIELYNPTGSTINIGGWTLTDDKLMPDKWMIPAITLEANSYLLIFASGKNRQVQGNELHTNFKLSGSGEYLGLYNNSGIVITEFDPAYPEQQVDVSYGYLEGIYVGFNDPTPGYATTAGAQTVVPAPTFDHSHGFYDAAFDLLISDELGSAQIYYTTDGSVPGTSNGFLYSSSIHIDSTSIIRAVAIVSGQEPSRITTCTYLFLNDVIHQPNNPTGYPANWGRYTELPGYAIADYEMDPELISDTNYAKAVIEALKDLPTISLVTDKDHFFSNVNNSDTGGIYIFTGPPLSNTVNGVGDGWIRPVSFEYFADGDTNSLQIDCGIKLQGGHSRRPEKSPKHSFRLVFRNEYGPTTLNYPIFGNDANTEFNSITLRAGFCNTWIHWQAEQRDKSLYLTDTWAKDVQKAMGHMAVENDFVHLYINGIYWGLYNTSERIDRKFAASYLRGDNEDFDVIKDYTEVVDGNIAAWNSMMSLANAGFATREDFQRIQGNNADGTPNGDYENLLDMNNFIDYFIINLYGGNTDWDHHNWAAIRNRVKPGKGFQFICWDEEHIHKDVYDMDAMGTNNSNCPSRIFQQLTQNADFRRLFADRVAKYCYNDGFLTPDKAEEFWVLRNNEVENSMFAEAARWGDYRRDVHSWQTGPYELYTKETHWDPHKDYLQNTYFPLRTDVFLNTLKAYGLYSPVDPPILKINNSPTTQAYINIGDELSIGAIDGEIYYTIDGSDPADWSNAVESEGYSLIPADGNKQVLVPKSDQGTAWMTDVGYDDSGWSTCSGGDYGIGGIGYDTDPNSYYHYYIALDVASEMHDGASPNTSCYVRFKFEVTQDQLDNMGQLLLPVAYDNGFAAWLNGSLVAESNASLPLSWNSHNSGDHPLERIEYFDISPFIDSLVVGTNLLAVQGVNDTVTSQNFFIYAELVGIDNAGGGEMSDSARLYTSPISLNTSTNIKARAIKHGVWSPMVSGHYVVPDELNDLMITEVLYHPINNSCSTDSLDGEKFEFIEIKNTGLNTMCLGGVKFEKGIDYEFEEDAVIEPGEFIVLARDINYFYARYGFVPFDEYNGKLDNDGERIMMVNQAGDTICSFKYNDNPYWPQSPDGEGNSLVSTDYDQTGGQDSSMYWRSSFEIGGSPGADDVAGIAYMLPDTCPVVNIHEPITLAEKTGVILDQNYPNPFSEITYIPYILNEEAQVKLSIYNIVGQQIATLVNSQQRAGEQLIEWNGRNNSGEKVEPGIYFYRLEVRSENFNNVVIKKMIITY